VNQCYYDNAMSNMYCPQCGRELDLDSGDVRFCRYCGFSLVDTKESLQGYSEQKRTGFSIVTWSYALLLIVTLLLHGKYIPLDTRWGYWLSAILIVVSVSFFGSASLSALKPAMFSKAKRGGRGALNPVGDNPNALKDAVKQISSLPALPGGSLTDLSEQERRTAKVKQPRSVAEGTTKRLDK
jgi:hypothetical protein